MLRSDIMKICPTCGKKALPSASVFIGLPFFRPFLKPARCKECNGYYKTVITKKYLKDSLFYAVLISLVAIFASLLYVKLSGFTYDNSFISNIILIILASFLLSFLLMLLTLGTESCNHKYELIPHDADFEIVTEDSTSLIFENKIYLIEKDGVKIPAIVKSKSVTHEGTFISFGFINPAFNDTEHFKNDDEVVVLISDKPYLSGKFTIV